MPETIQQRYFMRFDFKEALLLALLGGMIVATKMFIRIPLKVPGHSTALLVFFLVLGKGFVPRFGSGLIMGAFSGILATFTGMGKQGAFVFVKFLMPGLALDILAGLLFRLRPGKALWSTLSSSAGLGILVNLAKLGSNIALARLLDLPLERIETVVGVALVTHIGFGALGGLVAALVLRRLHRLLPRSLSRGNP